jgi:predicted transcriptional regulator
MTTPQKLKQIASEKGVTATEIAKHIGVSIATVTRVFNGKVSPRYEVVIKIEEYLRGR